MPTQHVFDLYYFHTKAHELNSHQGITKTIIFSSFTHIFSSSFYSLHLFRNLCNISNFLEEYFFQVCDLFLNFYQFFLVFTSDFNHKMLHPPKVYTNRVCKFVTFATSAMFAFGIENKCLIHLIILIKSNMKDPYGHNVFTCNLQGLNTEVAAMDCFAIKNGI